MRGGGSPGCGGLRGSRRGAADAARGRRRNSRNLRRPRQDACAVRVCPERANEVLAAVPAFPKVVAIEPRDSQGRLSSRLPRTPWDGWGGLKMSNLYVPRRWNSLLAPRSSKGRYRSPTGPLVVPVSMKTVRPRCPPGTRARRAHMARPPRRVCRFAGDPCGACAHHSRTKVTTAGGHVITSRIYASSKPVLPCKTRARPQIFWGQSTV